MLCWLQNLLQSLQCSKHFHSAKLDASVIKGMRCSDRACCQIIKGWEL